MSRCGRLFASRGVAQPEREVCWLHRLLYHRQQMVTEGVEINLLAQCRAESLDRLPRIILRAVEAAIHCALHRAPQWLEERGNQQRGDDDGDRLVLAAGKRQDGARECLEAMMLPI